MLSSKVGLRHGLLWSTVPSSSESIVSDETDIQGGNAPLESVRKSWWAYIPEVCEAGVVFDADTLEEALVEARRELRVAPWTEAYFYGTQKREQGFYIYELGPLHGTFTLPEED